MKKIYLLPLLLLFPFTSLQAEEDQDKTGYDLYKKRVETICEQSIYSPQNTFLKTKSYKKVTSGDGIEKAKKLYKKNMNNIYKCAMIQSQINSLQKIRKVLIKDSVALQSRLDKKIELKENRLKLIANQIGKEEDILKEDVEKIQKDINRLEKLTEKKEDKIDDNEKIIEKTFKRVNKCIRDNNESKITKKDVLRATTKELCKYHSYLEYLREHNSDLSNLIDKTGKTEEEIKKYNIGYITQLEQEKKNQIDEEITRSYKIFPIAFDAYNQYEANLNLHLHLELLKEDYIILRSKIYRATHPINQVVYKIANAMDH